MTTERNTVLPDDVAREFGLEVANMLRPVLTLVPEQISDDILESIGRIAFKRSLEIAEQVDFGE